MKRNDWQARFGAARRVTDKRLLQECERNLPMFEGAKTFEQAATEKMQRKDNDERERIARAFGRPI